MSSMGSNDPHEGSELQRCQRSSVGSNDPNQGSEIQQGQRSSVGSVDPHQVNQLQQGQTRSMGANDPHRSIELQQRQTSSLRPRMGRFFKRKRGIAKKSMMDRLRTGSEKEEIRKGQELVRKRFEEVEVECERVRRETKEIIKQNEDIQFRLMLMFRILKAREEGDLDLASILTQLLRRLGTVQRWNALSDFKQCSAKDDKFAYKVGQYLQYFMDLSTSRWPGLWDSQAQLLRATCRVECCSWRRPRLL
ncbi:hypothetical protein V6N12_069675 [Hibiscus sabdariffa]|uniref:Uncharacterized protein n=1 Tax=Hibiscus sabdariffa TaxID=183260 RepID=A0ABR2FEL4_9ROSI